MIRIRIKDSNDDGIWKRDLYTANIDYIIGENIYEYDMKNAGLNLCIYFELLDKKTISYLQSLNKDMCHRRIGELQRGNVAFAKEFNKCFSRMRKVFFRENNIQDSHVLSIRKDAIFLINKQCDSTVFSNVQFSLKHKFTSFHKFDNYEIYYRNYGNEISVKGINDTKLELHDDYMLKFLKSVFRTLETGDNKDIVNKIKKFASKYKKRELDIGYYRELNSDSSFVFTNSNGEITVKSEYATDRFLDDINDSIEGECFDIDISYNYMTYITKLIQRYFFIQTV